MKVQLLIGFLTWVVSSSVFAGGDQIYTSISCRTPHVADAGYSLRVETGGFAGLTTVHLEEIRLFGALPLGSYVVRSEDLGKDEVSGRRVYTDAASGGGTFNLTVFLDKIVSSDRQEKEYEADFTAESKSGPISGRLFCVLHSPK